MDELNEVEEPLQFTTSEVPTDPVTFSIDGEVFTCIPFLPGVYYLKYARLLAKGGIVSERAVEEFFEIVMGGETGEEYKRFIKFCEDPQRKVDSDLLARIFLGLYSRYASGPGERSRPTKPSGASRSGRSKTGAGSKAKSSSAVSASTDSTPKGSPT